ncbi:MAG: toll/interleukin-1 receptor domain-containing protein [Chloroflexota bacterium]
MLEKPPTSPNTFISYRRGHSTGFALYLEARLRLAGNNAVYVDKALEPGSQWRDVLTEKINQSKFMIVLCTHGTFDGDPEKNWVFREVRMAQQAGCAIIPILHPAGRDDFNARDIPNSPELDALRDSQVIKVQDATAAEYEVAANKLLSYMGYSTY